MNRRTFLAGTAAASMQQLDAAPASIPIIDCHIHLFDVDRPGGVPWPQKSDTTLYKTASMHRYRKIAGPLGIVGAIEVEASPLLEDNQYVLDIAAKDKMLVGTVGDLEPDSPQFGKQLERFHKNPLFRGIRYGNIWNRDLSAAVKKAEFIAGIKLLAEAGLSLDSANPDPALIAAILYLTDKAPSLRVVIDHLPRLEKPAEPAARRAYEADLHELGRRKQVYVKVSGVVRRVNGRVPEDPAFYTSTIDELWDIFGEDRLLYGSDWPNSDQWAEYPVELNIVRAYFLGKGRAAAEKYFWRNSISAYRWIHREKSQPV